MVTTKRIAIIPARGGSKRIPKKNIIDFHGKPLIAWTIEAAIKSNLFDRIIVSTDSEEIAEISRGFGALVPFMRKVANDDYTSVSVSTVATLIESELFWNESYESVTQLMPTCPLRTADDIKLAFQNFILNDAPSQISCFKFGWNNPWWAASIDVFGSPKKIFTEKYSSRSQDLQELYCPTGAIWIASADFLKLTSNFYSEGHTYFPMNWIRSIDIDEKSDLLLAEKFFLLEPMRGR
jgi:N-acylneuraminate cytidylyltransferase